MPASEPEPDRRPRISDLLRAGVGIRSASLTVLALLGILYTLYFAQPVLLPIVLALLLSVLLTPLVRVLHQRLRVPPGIGAAVVLAALLGTLGMAASFVAEPATAWVQTVPERIPELKARLKAFQKPLEKIRDTSEQVASLTNLGAQPGTTSVVDRGSTPAEFVMQQTPALLANLCVMGILLYFLLASGDTFLRKLVRMIPTFEDKRRAVEIAREIQDRLSGYLRTVTVINLCLGAAVGFAAWCIGLQNFMLWGVLAFVLNYIPYFGALVGVLATLVVSLLSFESTAQALLMPGVYLALNTLEGNFITPLVLGRFLTLNPAMIFLSLMFWGWIWGIPGALLAVPILATIKIVCDHIKPLAPLGVFIGGDPDEAAPA